MEEARSAGLGVTIHVGEEGGEHGLAETWEVAETLRPERIGHGILAAGDEDLMSTLGEAGIVLEICPTSNLLTRRCRTSKRSVTRSAPSSTTTCRLRSRRTGPR